MSYDKLKKQIVDKLIEAGFTQKDDSFVHIETRQSQVIINGQASIQEHKPEIKLSIIGEGAIDDDVTIGLNLNVSGEDKGDFWIRDLEDLATFFRIR